MLASINPLGERARNRRWSLTVTAYLVGSVLGGAVMGALLGLVGALLGSWVGLVTSTAIIVTVCALGLAADLGVGGLRLPTIVRSTRIGATGIAAGSPA